MFSNSYSYSNIKINIIENKTNVGSHVELLNLLVNLACLFDFLGLHILPVFSYPLSPGLCIPGGWLSTTSYICCGAEKAPYTFFSLQVVIWQIGAAMFYQVVLDSAALLCLFVDVFCLI